jgi:rfaE bifunctional protein kinase chain/domain
MTIAKEKVYNYLSSFKNKKVLIVGDVMIDSYMWGNANRISPEAPIPIVSITNKDYRLGGAANVALNISALNAVPYLCSIIGTEQYGNIFKNLLKQNNLSDKGIICSEKRATTVKTRVISNGQQLLRVDEEIETSLTIEQTEFLFSKIKEITQNHAIDIIIFEDYDKGIITPLLIEKITKLASEHGILTTVDPKKKNFEFYNNVDLFKPNFLEFTEGLKVEILKNDIECIKTYTKEFIENRNIRNLMITLSEYGILISDKNTNYHYPAMLRNIADVSGAGDTVISIASLLLASGATLSEIAEISNIAGGLVCGKVGVVPINTQELKACF